MNSGQAIANYFLAYTVLTTVSLNLDNNYNHILTRKIHDERLLEEGFFDCRRDLSRNVVKIFETQFLAKLSTTPMELSTECPFHPSNNVYSHHEASKRRSFRSKGGENEIQCGICGKVFKNEFYMDLHLHRMHKNALNVSDYCINISVSLTTQLTLQNNSAICLADYCSVFACITRPKTFIEAVTHSKLNYLNAENNVDTCNDNKLESIKLKCKLLMKRYYIYRNFASYDVSLICSYFIVVFKTLLTRSSRSDMMTY